MSADFLEGLETDRNLGGRPRKGKATTCRQLLITCGDCGAKLRGTRSAFAAGLPSCACGGSFRPGDEAAAVALDPDYREQVVELEAGEALERAARKDLADDSRGFSSRCNCGVCGRFKPKPSSTCDYCGDIPTTHDSDRHEVAAFNREHGARF